MHGGDAYAALELHPVTSFGVCTIFNGNYELKEDGLKKNKKERWEVLDLESHSKWCLQCTITTSFCNLFSLMFLF